MRRIFSYVLLSVGLMLIFVSPLIKFYSVPRVEKAPLDRFDELFADGSGVYFSPNAKILGDVGPVPLENTQIYRGDGKAGSKSVAVYDVFSSTKDLTRGAVIEATTERVAFDRTSGLAVHCCGENPPHQGLFLKFPFGTKRITYQFWDSTAEKAFPARYLKDQTLDGLNTYEFESDVPPTKIGSLTVGGGLEGEPSSTKIDAAIMYEAQTLVWIEPTTGGVVKASRLLHRWLEDPSNGQRLLILENVHAGYNDATVAHEASYLKGQVKQLRLATFGIPVFAPIIGVLMIAGGFLLRRTPKGKKAGASPEAEKEASKA